MEARAADFPQLAVQVSRGVVVVEGRSRSGARTGSGFLLERRGLIATALHTIEGARRVRVTVPGRFAASDARLLATSPAWDLAVLEVEWPAGEPYPGLPLDASLMTAGTEVALTGYGRLGDEPSSVPLTVRGIVSGAFGSPAGAGGYLLDLGAREGFSGSPVYRTDNGTVVGVLTRVHANSGVTGPGGAAPAAALKALVTGLGSALGK